MTIPTKPTTERSLTPAPTKESRDHSADLPGASELKKTVESQEKAVPDKGTKEK